MSDKSMFDRLSELLNGSATEEPAQQKEMSVEERLKDMLNPASPEVNAADQQVVQPSLVPEEMQGNWWEKALNAFSAHQEQERQAFNNKQIQDQKVFADYQLQEKSKFDNFQKQEFEAFWANIERHSGNRPASAPAAPEPGSYRPPIS